MTNDNYRPRPVKFLKPCGHPSAYRRHLRHGETPCAACKAAEAKRHAEWLAARKAAS